MKHVQIVVWAIATVFLTFVLSRRIDAIDDPSFIKIVALGSVIPFASGVLLGVLAIVAAQSLTPGVRSFRLVSSIWLVAIAVCFAVGAADAVLLLQRQGSFASWSGTTEFLIRLADLCTKIGLGLLAAAWIRPNASATTSS
jgi:hypothetical protein